MGYLEDVSRATQLSNIGQTPGETDSWSVRLAWQQLENQRKWQQGMMPKPRPQTDDSQKIDLSEIKIVRQLSPAEQQQKDLEFTQNVKFAGWLIGGVLIASAGIKAYQWTNKEIITPTRNFFSSITLPLGQFPSPYPTETLQATPPQNTTPPQRRKAHEEDIVTPSGTIISLPEIVEEQDIATSQGNQESPPAYNASKIYEAHIIGFLNETHSSLQMPWNEAQRVSRNIIGTLLSKPLDKPRYAFASKTSSGETIAIASTPVAQDGSVSTLNCISEGGKITDFGRTSSIYTNDGSLFYQFSRQVLVTTTNGQKIDISAQINHIGDCRRAFALLKQNHKNDLPELGSPHIK